MGKKKENMFVFISLLVAATLSLTTAYPSYQDEIPNGNNVNHPCLPNYRWPGVGHENRNGGGTRNVFGSAFSTAGHKWTKSLCQQDSDGDGKTNGDELGDPNCVWAKGQVPTRTTGITHPGVCEPLNSTSCVGKTSFVSCQADAFDNCDVIKSPDVKGINITFPRHSLPSTETNYMCMTFDLPSDQDYHIVAYEAIIDNSHVIHHMLLYGCEDTNSSQITKPEVCSMSSSNCATIISGWTVGKPGECFGDKMGFRIGQTGYRRVRLEIHYNNPNEVADYTDASGLHLYYRPARAGVQDLTTFVTGQTLLELQPGKSRLEQVGVCEGSCTRNVLTKPAYVVAVLNHMHYLGTSMKLELFRNGSRVTYLSNDDFYSYDSPVTHYHDPPVQLLPGDEIVTTCVYNTLTSRRWVYFGEATSDEMCFGFISMYPKDAVVPNGDCNAVGPLSSCQLASGAPVGQCNWKAFLNFSSSNTIKIVTDLEKNCNLNGFCRPECTAVVENLRSHPCLTGEAGKLVKYLLARSKQGLELLGRLHSCPTGQTQSCVQDCPAVCSLQETGLNGAGRGASGAHLVSFLCTVVVVMTSYFV
ncbi:unnamed protein product [Lymnaea stagnalis]|uniref:Temptin n=1 Tax=Lymnaea stagnalis TaxID=6523 RepID=A0AAV2I695_LYMST